MFPPDDDYLEDSPESNPEPEEAELNAAMALIPADFYEQLAPVLQLCAVANFLLLGRAADPVPQAISQLTSFDLAATRQVSRLRSSAGLGRLLLRQPERLHDYLLVGQLTFASPLFGAVRELLPAIDDEDGAVSNCLREFVIESSDEIITNLTEFLNSTFPSLDQDWHLRRLQLESIFARLEDTLVPMQVPAEELAADAEPVAGLADARLQLRFPAAQLAALQLALALPQQLTYDPELPFARAVAALPDLAPARADALRRRLTPAGGLITLTLGELALLYQVAQLRALALVSGALDELSQFGGSSASPATPLEDCAELEQFVQYVQATFPNEPALTKARRAVETLAKLL